MPAWLRIGRYALFLPHIWTTIMALSARAQAPWALGRYSKALLSFNAVNLAALAFGLVCVARGRHRAALPALLVLVLLTYLGPTNNAIALMPLAVPMYIASRVAFALLFLALAATALRSPGGPTGAKPLLLSGTLLLVFNAVDLAGLAVLGRRAAPSAIKLTFRRPVDLAAIEPDAIVIIGDSFVFGNGVKEGEAFAAVLGERLGEARAPVYNLGVPGTGLPEYLTVLKSVPARDTAVVCYYMNDIPSRETAGPKLRQAVASLGRTSFILRLTADLIGIRVYPTAEDYIQGVFKDYDRSDPTYPARWAEVTSNVRLLADEARRGARRGPIFVIFPVMYDFSSYPIEQAHSDLAEVARAAGFEVIDLLPAFAEAFPDGKRYLVSPDDNHFNAEVHRKTAEVLSAVIERRRAVGIARP